MKNSTVFGRDAILAKKAAICPLAEAVSPASDAFSAIDAPSVTPMTAAISTAGEAAILSLCSAFGPRRMSRLGVKVIAMRNDANTPNAEK